MEPIDNVTPAELAIWQPWARQLVAVIDGARETIRADLIDSEKRARIGRLAEEVRELLSRLETERDLPNALRYPIALLRAPDPDPIRVSEAIDRLTALAQLTCDPTPTPSASTRRPRRFRGRLHAVRDQQEIPGLEPLTEGATA
jgi:hypothetical protein